MNKPEHIYDALYTFESGQWKKNHYPIHKRLNLNGHGNLLNWMIEHIPFKEGDSILDAGCGTGHILISLACKMNIKGRGISISKKEVDHACNCLNNESLKGQLQFELQDYAEPLADQYDKILAIESLKHASDLDRVLANFSK